MKVTVFGGASPRPGQPEYEEAYLLGRELGGHSHIVLTGGYMGTMEAVSRGAAETGAHVIGVTCEEVEHYRPVKANQWVVQEIHVFGLLERIQKLITECDVAIALPGGAGTLAEVSAMWNLLIIDGVPRKPLIVIGAGWKAVFEAFAKDLGKYTPEKDRNLITFAATIEEAAALVQIQAAKIMAESDVP